MNPPAAYWQPIAVGKIDDPGQVRVMLWQTNKPVHAPLKGLGLIDADLTAIAAMTGEGAAFRTGTDTWELRSFAGTTGEIAIQDGDGVAGDPTLSLPAALTFTGKTVTGGVFNSGTFGGAFNGTLNGAIGSTTPAAAAVTTLAASGIISANAGQIEFPATQNPSANVNALDDARRGTFTPAVTGITSAGAGTYSNRVGRYVKLGKLVYFVIDMTWTAHTGTGSARLTGLPFASATGVRRIPIVVENYTFTGLPFGNIAAGASTMELLTQSSAAAAAALVIDTVASLSVSGCYEAAA